MILAPKMKKANDFFRYLEEICEIPIKFDAFSAKIGAKIAKFQWFCLKFMKMSPKFATKICWIFEVGEVQRNINLVDLAKSFQTSIYLQKSASIQPRTSRSKFGSQITLLITYRASCSQEEERTQARVYVCGSVGAIGFYNFQMNNVIVWTFFWHGNL